MWVFNVWLYLCFLFGGIQYQERVNDGVACYVFVASVGDEDPSTTVQPYCFYDPSNLNPGN